MVIDSSAWVAIVLGESDAEIFESQICAAIERFETIYVPASVIFEAGWILDRKGKGGQFDALLRSLRPVLVPIDADIAGIARSAASIFGKGIHKAKLNFGDCMSYAVCAKLGERLLFKGDDFVHTDVQSVL